MGDGEGKKRRRRAELLYRATRNTARKTAACVAIQVPLETEATPASTAVAVTGCPKIEAGAEAAAALDEKKEQGSAAQGEGGGGKRRKINCRSRHFAGKLILFNAARPWQVQFFFFFFSAMGPTVELK